MSILNFVNMLMLKISMLGADEGLFSDTSPLNFLDPIYSALQSILIPVLIVAGTVGSIYAVVLGINMARADSAEKREEAKKRVINVVLALVIVIVLIIIFQFVITEDNLEKLIGDDADPIGQDTDGDGVIDVDDADPNDPAVQSISNLTVAADEFIESSLIVL